jgi:hypothetical protein
VCRVCFLPGQQTLSFLAYMLRGYAEHLRPYQEQIPKCVIALLLNCPHECAAIRKVPPPFGVSACGCFMGGQAMDRRVRNSGGRGGRCVDALSLRRSC